MRPARHGTPGSRSAVIFGASSLVGRHLVKRLSGRGYSGWCLSRGRETVPYELPPGFSWRILAASEFLRVPADATVFSLAPVSGLPDLVGRMAGGSRVIALSTSSVLFKGESRDPDERGLVREFLRAEEEVQRLCRDRDLAWTLFRPTLIYDPGRDRNVTAIAAVARRFGASPVVWPGLGERQPIHADDVARAMATAPDAPGARNALFDLPGGETLTYREMVRTVFRSLGKRPVLVYLPLGPARFAFRAFRAVTGMKYSIASLERMNTSLTVDPAPVQKALGITCRPFEPEFPNSRAGRLRPAPAGDNTEGRGLFSTNTRDKIPRK